MKDFLKQVLAVLVAVTIVAGAAVAMVAALFSMATPGPPVLAKGTVLTLDMSVNITEASPTLDPEQALQDAVLGETPAKSAQLHALLKGLEWAATDDRIAGLYLHGSFTPWGYGSGYAALRELRDALERFQQAGKPVHAFLTMPRARDYYLASVAKRITLHPTGAIELPGLASEVMYYAAALKKYGVGVQVSRVGKYKSAVEPFLTDKMSPENRLQHQAYLAAIWDDLLDRVCRARQLDRSTLQRWVDTDGFFTAETARDRKLVDEVGYFDEVLTDLKKVAGMKRVESRLPQISLADYAEAAVERDPHRASKNKIAMVYAEGVILDGAGAPGNIGGASLARELRRFREDSGVKAVVLRVNSPGGGVLASEMIRREVTLTQKVKPVIISMGTVAASGGYWISANAERIFASSNTLTGSIGIYGLIPNVKELANQHGVTWDSVKTGKFADAMGVSRPKTDEEMAILQKYIDQGYDKFIDLVATGRKLNREAVQEVAQGRVWAGRDALRLGLVDEIGGLEAAIAYAAKKAGLGQDWMLVQTPHPKSLPEMLLDYWGGEKRPVARAGKASLLISELREELAALYSLNDPMGCYVMLPYVLRVR